MKVFEFKRKYYAETEEDARELFDEDLGYLESSSDDFSCSQISFENLEEYDKKILSDYLERSV